MGDRLVQSYAVRHLGFADREGKGWLEESLRLRREVDFLPGVAAALLALAELDFRRGERELGLRELDEAARVARDSGAHRILHWIEQARSAV